MAQNVLTPARTGRDDAGTLTANPNRGRGRVGRMTPAPRLSDGKRHPVTVYVRATPRHAPALLGRLPRVKVKRRPWTAARVFELAARAESRGHFAKSAALLDIAVTLDR